MKLRFARFVMLSLTSAPTLIGGWCFWTQPGAFPIDHPSLYGLALAPLVVAILGVVATFAPFDNPRSALRWAATLSGLAVGVALGGLVLYTPSFLWLSGPLLLYAACLRLAGRVVASAPPTSRKTCGLESGAAGPHAGEIDAHDLPTRADPSVAGDAIQEGADPCDPYGLGTTFAVQSALDDTAETAPKTRGVNLIFVFFSGLGVALAYSWSPGPGHARPAALTADTQSSLTPPRTRLVAKRISREHALVEMNGQRVSVKASLLRPKIVIDLREHRIVVEPCLLIEEGSIDGLASIPALNGYSLEPGYAKESGAVAYVEFVEGKRRGWAHIEYRAGRVRYDEDSLAGLAPALGRRASASDITAVVDIELVFKTGRVTIDAWTRLERPVAVHKATLGFVQLRDTKPGPITLGLGPDGVSRRLPKAEGGRWPPKQLVFLSTDGGVSRLLKAGRGDEGPYESLEVAPFNGWIALPGAHERILVVAPDWARQASLAPSRCAGHGLLENCLMTWWGEDAEINLIFDLASTRIGSGRVTTTLPPGIYRNRVVVTALGGRVPAEVAAQELERIGAGSAPAEDAPPPSR